MVREVSEEEFQLLQQMKQSANPDAPPPLPWFRRSKFIAWLMILFLLFGAVAGIPFLLVLWTGQVERPRLTSKPHRKPCYTRTEKVLFSILIPAFLVAHLFTVGM